MYLMLMTHGTQKRSRIHFHYRRAGYILPETRLQPTFWIRQYSDFLDRAQMLTQKSLKQGHVPPMLKWSLQLKQGHVAPMLKWSLQYFYAHHHELADYCEISTDLFFYMYFFFFPLLPPRLLPVCWWVCLTRNLSFPCCVFFFVLCAFAMCPVPNIASVPGLSILQCHFGFR